MNRKISFDNILDSIIDKNSISKVFARTLVNEMASLIQQGLLRDSVVNLSGLGIFRLHSVDARPGRNIQTGESITIPAHRKVMFKPEKHLRELINKKYNGLTPKILDDIIEHPKETKKETAKDDTVKPAFFTEAFDKFDGEKELSESPKIESNKKADPVEKSQVKAESIDKDKDQDKDQDKDRSMAPVLYSVLAILIIIFLFIQFSGNDEELSGPVADHKQEVVDKTVAPKVETVKPTPQQQQTSYKSYQAQKGDNLWRLAYKNYNDGYLWPLILQANASKISNPDLIEPGTILQIPILEKSGKLSKPDNKNLAKGHVLAYLAYKNRKNSDAVNHLFVANKYDPEYVKSSLAKIDETDMKSVRNLSFGSAR